MGNLRTPAPLRYLPLDVAAERFDVSVRTIRRRISDGTIPGYRVGGRLRVREDHLERLAEPLPTVAGA